MSMTILKLTKKQTQTFQLALDRVVVNKQFQIVSRG